MSRKKHKKPRRINLSPSQAEDLLKRAEKGDLNKDDLEIIRGLIETLQYLGQAVDQKSQSIKRLLQIIFGSKSEKSSEILDDPLSDEEGDGSQKDQSVSESTDTSAETGNDPSSLPKGNGKNGHEDYTGAKRVCVSCDDVTRGGICPKCQRGKTYPIAPKTLVRVTAETPLSAKVYELEKLRCNTCGAIFTAKSPEGVSSEKYDSKSIAMLALLHYGTGMPFHRMEKLQKSLGIPLPSSTQWDMIERGADSFYSIFSHLLDEAAQGKLIHNDDTTAKILEFMGKRSKGKPPDANKPHRKGMFTTGIISKTEGKSIAIFYTGTRHAGENLEELLRRRRRDQLPPIQMCDGLEHNVPKDFKTILSNCIAHSRRKFVEILENFPEECRHVILEFLQVYRHDTLARDQRMTDGERLNFHQRKSEPIMTALRTWMFAKFKNKEVEPNSGLGQAITYFLKRWDPLTLFLREPGVPLDNNICERALKKSILTRKNSLFYKTQNGAKIGDIYTSLIHTCELGGVNPFDYLSEVLKNKESVRLNPENWMPWNFCEVIPVTQ